MAFDWASLIGGATSAATGGIFGILGAVGTKLFEAWERKQELDVLREKNQHEIAMKEKDAEIMAQEWAARTKIAHDETEAKKDVADSEAFSKSFDSEPKRYAEGFTPPTGGKIAKFVQGLGWIMMVALDALRGSIRPGMAIYLCYIVTEMYSTQRAVLAMLGADQVTMMAAVYKAIVDTMLFLFTTCVLWYYGVRNRQAAPRVNR